MLALWEYFWNVPDWTGAPPVSVSSGAVVALSDGGTNFKGYWRPKPESGLEDSRDRADQDYWDVRERYLRRFMEPVLKAEPPPVKTREPEPITADEGQSHLAMLQAARDAVIARARIAENQDILRAETARVIKLTLDIQTLRKQYNHRAAMILLLDLF